VGQFLHNPATALPVCCTQLKKRQQQEVVSSYFIIKRKFLWGIYKKKARSFGGIAERKKQRLSDV